jgi:hypothetical protein
MKREVFQLAFVTACVAYLIYYVMTTRAGVFGNVAVGALSIYFISEWSQVFYMLGLWSGRTQPKREGDR